MHILRCYQAIFGIEEDEIATGSAAKHFGAEIGSFFQTQIAFVVECKPPKINSSVYLKNFCPLMHPSPQKTPCGSPGIDWLRLSFCMK